MTGGKTGDILKDNESLDEGLEDNVRFSRIPSRVILSGDERTAYRDPAVIYEGGRFYLFCTKTECCEGGPYMTTVETVSEDLIHWSSPVEITPRDRSLNFSSLGNEWR